MPTRASFKCRTCGGEHRFVPHPSKPGRVVAYCGARGVCETDELRILSDETGLYDPFELLPGVGAEIAQALRNAGFGSFDQIVDADDGDLLAVPGIGLVTVGNIRAYLRGEG